MAGAQFNDRVGNLSQTQILKDITDTVSRSNVIVQRVFHEPKPWVGKTITQNIFTSQSSQGEFFNGVKQLNSDIDMTTTSLNWYPTGFAQPITVSQVDKALSGTEAGIISVQKASSDFAANSMKSRLGDAAYGIGVGDLFDGVGLICDDGTLSSTYGGLSRTTYGTYINGQTNAASGGVLDMDFLASLDDDATISGDSDLTPTACLTTKANFTLYESLMEPTKQAHYQAFGYGSVGAETAIGQIDKNGSGNMGASGGFQCLDYRGKPFIRDEKCPTGKLYMLNERKMEFHTLNLPNLKQIQYSQQVTSGANSGAKTTPYQFRPMVEPYNMPTAEVGYYIVYGNLIHRDPRLNAVGTGITTV